ncbi:hypothetical protein A3A67_00780 [Candidatus Peribacteria bacterium RIFCSPLOWO2_01_FULL_51_18]|nr:MAG: hypothetical protein A3A67_00780 [Candidatus Peribacteria bacterium RIFCSPLOWO2_01_FULL_51_18]
MKYRAMVEVEPIFDPEKPLMLRRKVQHDGRQFVVKFPKKFERLLKLNKERVDYFEFLADFPRDRKQPVQMTFKFIEGTKHGKKKI